MSKLLSKIVNKKSLSRFAKKKGSSTEEASSTKEASSSTPTASGIFSGKNEATAAKWTPEQKEANVDYKDQGPVLSGGLEGGHRRRGGKPSGGSSRDKIRAALKRRGHRGPRNRPY